MKKSLICVGIALLITNCATESHKTFEPELVNTTEPPSIGKKKSVVVGNFRNHSTFGRGIFSSDNGDLLGDQAHTILKTHLQQSNRFNVLDRSNMEINSREASLSGVSQKVKGAEITITGQVTAFGRKDVGDRQLFGILGRGKTQVAYAKVMMNVVNVKTSEILRSVQASGEYQLSNREVLGFGGTSGYDSTLNGKVLDLAIRDAVDKLTADLDAGKW